MEATKQKISLDKVFFTRSVVIAIQNHNPSKTDVNRVIPENRIHVIPFEDKPGVFQVTMRTVINPSKDPSGPYLIDMECVGLFIADSALPPDEATNQVMLIGHGVLYGAIREAVAWLTGRQPYGQLMLNLSILQSQSEEPKQVAIQESKKSPRKRPQTK